MYIDYICLYVPSPISPTHPTSLLTLGSPLTNYYQQPHEYNYYFQYECVCSHSQVHRHPTNNHILKRVLFSPSASIHCQ